MKKQVAVFAALLSLYGLMQFCAPAREAAWSCMVYAVDATPFEPAQPRDQSPRRAIKNHLKSVLLDYESARIDWDQCRTRGNSYVVPVNAKNRFGGYVGWRDYLVPIP